MVLTVAMLVCVHCQITAAEEIREAVESGNNAFIAAFLKGDSKTVAALYTDDAQVIAPGSAVASGQSAIAAFWQKVIATGVKDLTLSTMTVEAAGDLAYEDGLVKLTGTNGEASTSRYVVVWKRSHGKWKLHRDIWNAE
jgi:uncharacterized protein (TIGR02246 family)